MLSCEKLAPIPSNSQRLFILKCKVLFLLNNDRTHIFLLNNFLLRKQISYWAVPKHSNLKYYCGNKGLQNPPNVTLLTINKWDVNYFYCNTHIYILTNASVQVWERLVIVRVLTCQPEWLPGSGGGLPGLPALKVTNSEGRPFRWLCLGRSPPWPPQTVLGGDLDTLLHTPPFSLPFPPNAHSSFNIWLQNREWQVLIKET